MVQLKGFRDALPGHGVMRFLNSCRLVLSLCLIILVLAVTTTAEYAFADFNVTISGAASANGVWSGASSNVWTPSATGANVSTADIETRLNAGTSVIINTTGGGAESGDIQLNSSVTWNSSSQLTLSAWRNISINSAITATGSGSLALQYGMGAVAAGNTATYSINAPVTLPAGSSFSTVLGSDVVDTPVNYTVITNLGTSGSSGDGTLQGMAGNLSGNYALGADIDASITSGWNGGTGFTPISVFIGTFDGLGHTINGLYINRSANNAGLFGQASGAKIRNIGLTGVNISSGFGAYQTGIIIGDNIGSSIANSYSSGTVQGTFYTGGLVGRNNAGTITGSYSTATVSGQTALGGLVGDVEPSGSISKSYFAGTVSGNGPYQGGIVGYNMGTISNCYNTGAITTGTTDGGGLAGFNTGSISNSYSTGSVSTPTVNTNSVGGLAGAGGGSVTSCYWDTTTSGRATSVGGGTGLATAQMMQAGSLSGLGFTTPGDGNSSPTWWLSEGNTRPFLRSEYSTTITNAHQIQLMVMNLGASYTLANNINMVELTRASGMWDVSKGFVPVGDSSTPFTGQFNGLNRTISNLTINLPLVNYVGLYGYAGAASAISNIGLLGGSVTGGTAVGGLIGRNEGTVSNAYNTGAVTGSAIGAYTGGLTGQNGGSINSSRSAGSVNGGSSVGGLTGSNWGSIANSYSTGNVSGDYNLGGLVGWNNAPGSPGTITYSYATGSVSGTTIIGGLVGLNDVSIANSYSSGNVIGTGVVGGLVGLSSGTVTNSYWDTQTSGQSVASTGPGTLTNTTGLTTGQMMQQANFTGWDFATTWRIYGGHTYPLLKGFLTPLTITADNVTKTYDGAPYTSPLTNPAYSVAGAGSSGLLFNTANPYNSATSVGSYTPDIYSSQLGYDISYVNGVLTINPDTTPDSFSFTNQSSAPLNSVIESNPVTVTGISGSTSISISGGDYAVSTDTGVTWGTWTNTGGSVNPNDQVKVRQSSSASYATTTGTTLTIGGVSATFSVTTQVLSFSLTVTVSGSGIVTSDIAGINCGAACSASYTSGTAVTLTATADSGNTFSGWTGCDSFSANSCTVIMSSIKNVTATFETTSCYSTIPFSTIQATSMSSASIDGSNNGSNQIPTGTILAYKTNTGRYGKVLVTNYAYTLSLMHTSYNADGSVFHNGSFNVNGTYEGDLDAGAQTSFSPDSDFFWHQVDGTIRYVEPMNSAVFAVLGANFCGFNGACGTANGQSFAAAPTTNLCSTGTPTTVIGAGPWTWMCNGINGGTPSPTCTANVAPVDLASGLVAWYPFNGNANDATVNGNNGTVNGASLTTDRFGNANGAYGFNGTNNYINAGNAASLEPSTTNKISAAAWVKFNSLTGPQTVLGKWGASLPGAYVLYKYLDTGDQYAGANRIIWNINNNTSAISSFPVVVGQWYHVVGVADNNGVSLYINGQLAGSAAGITTILAGSTDLRIGFEDSAPSPLNGSIDDVRIYNRALSLAEVQALYTEAAPSATYTLSLAKTGTGTGSIASTIPDTAINCGATCSASYASGAIVTLTATPDLGSVFTGWSGGGCSGTGDCTVTMATAKTVTAHFNDSSLTTFSYDFNSLTGSDIFVNDQSPNFADLNGQDGWTSQGFVFTSPAGFVMGVTAISGFDGTQALRFENSGAGYGADASHKRTVPFSIPVIDGSTTKIVMQGDFQVGAWANVLRFAYDSDSDGVIRQTNPAEIGPGLNVGTVPGVMVIAADGTQRSVPLAALGLNTIGGDWVRLRLVIYPTANGGAGMGNVYYQSLTRGDTALQPVLGLQNIAMGLNGSATVVTNPALWDAVYTHFEGSGNQLDNLLLATGAAPMYQLIATKSGAGVVTADAGVLSWSDVTGTALYDNGTPVTLTARPAPGGTFTGWSGEGCTGTGTCTVTMDAARNVTAAFSDIVANALHFDGSDDYVDVSGLQAWDLSSNFSMEVWVNPESNPGADHMIYRNGTCNSGWHTVSLTLYDNRVYFDVQDTTDAVHEVIQNGSLAQNQWSHVAVTYDNASLKLYINGVLNASVSGGSLPKTNSYGFIGADPQPLCGGPVRYQYNGMLREFSIWNRALSPSEIASSMGRTLTVADESGLTAYYPFNQGTPGGENSGVTTLLDTKGGQNGTLYNFTLTGTTSNWVRAYNTVTYNWVTGSWSACSAVCGSGTQSRTVECRNQSGIVVADASCLVGGPKLFTVQACDSGVLCQATINVTKTGAGAGTIISIPPDTAINCGATCSASYTTGTIVTLTTSPDSGSVFTGWSGACSGSGNCTVTMDAAKSVTANFDPTPNLTSGLVAYYPFTGNANDASGNGNNGTVNGASLTTDRFGNANGAYGFNGINNYINAGNAASLEPSTTNKISAAAWVKFNSLTGPQTVLGKWGASLPGAYVLYKYLDTGDQYAGANRIIWNMNNNTSAISSFPVVVGQWYHVVGVADNNGVSLYINGQLAGSAAGITTILAGSTDLRIGFEDSAPSPLNGSIDDVRIYNRALSLAEVQALYTEAAPSATYTLSLAKTGTGTGSIASTIPDTAINCGATCSASYTSGAIVTLTAMADSGSFLTGWSGCDSTSGNQCTVNMAGARNVAATFDLIPPVPLSLATTGLVNGSYGATYSQTLMAISGIVPYTWSVAAGSLPPGLSLSGDTISGTPTQAGSFTFTLQVTDSAATLAVASKDFSVTIDKAILTVTATSTTKPPGFANPDFTATYSGFVNNDKEADLLGAPIFATTATTESPIGSYDIMVSQGTLALPNYNFAFVNGILSISEMSTGVDGRTTAPISVTAAPGAKVVIAAGTLLTTADGQPVKGTLTMTSTSASSISSLPQEASRGRTSVGTSLVALGSSIDLNLSAGGVKITKIDPPMMVKVAIPSTFATPGAGVDYYSFDGTNWTKENKDGSANVNADGTVDMQVGHLSIWAVAKFEKLPSGKIALNSATTEPVTVADALRALQIAVGMIPPSANDLTEGDVAPLVNGRPSPNKQINVGDAIVIMQKSLGVVGW